MSDPETLKIYAEKAEEYAGLTEGFNTADPALSAFIAAVPKGGRVLDLGCGPGASAAEMARAGLDVLALDPVAEMVALAARHPGVTTRQAGFDDIDEDAAFDGIWANFSLLHAPKADMPRHLATLVKALKPGGIFHIALKTGTGEQRDRLGRFYAYYTDAELSGLLEAAGLTITDRRTGKDTGLDGSIAPWIALRAHA
jgi:2-polyprenyl-3-methyl-5-hydroxy-6-metoxy-1,4-benzoquinol methylase